MKSSTGSAVRPQRDSAVIPILLCVVAAALAVAFWYWRSVAAPLPYYSFQSDPEIAYFDNSLLLANGLRIEHTDHPGTALQLTGAVIARGLGLPLTSAFDAAALQRFMLCWRLVALASLLGTGFWLAAKLKQKGSWVLAAVLLLAAFDYQTLVYWLTFTPESAFFVLYFPFALVCAVKHGGPGKSSFGQGLAWSVALGFLTTIKLTLWPVTLFLLGLMAFSNLADRQSWKRFALYVLTALAVYAVIVTVLAERRTAPWRWLLALAEHSGRYGAVQAGEGAFPPLSLGLKALGLSFELQAYTTVPVFAGIVATALWLLHPGQESRQRLRSVGFLFTLFLLLVMFFKHPYQGKYLMPASLLCLLFFAVQAVEGRLPEKRILAIAALIFGFASVNAVLTQRLLYDTRIARDQRIYARIDAWLAKTPHDRLIFSGRLPYPQPIFLESLPPPIWPLYNAHFGPVSFNTSFFYSPAFQHLVAVQLPLTSHAKAIAFLNLPSVDPRWRLVDSLPEDGLYVYQPIP